MPTLQTKGFALSALPRSPNIPANIGAVDVKAIYDGVRQGLAAAELARSAPSGMALADAETAAKTQQAPLQTRQVLAQTEGIEQQTPLRTAILASEASPEMLDAKRQALLSRGTRSPSGEIQLATALSAAKLRLAENPEDASAAQLVAVLEPMALRKSAVSAADPQAAIQAGIEKNAATNATRVQTTEDTNQTRRDTNAATNEVRVTTAEMMNEAKRDLASMSDTRLRELASAADETKRKLAADELSARQRIAKDRILAQQEAQRANRDVQLEKIDLKNREKLAKALGGLEAFESNASHVEDLITKAISLTDNTSAGIGSIVNGVPLTKARALRGVLDSIRANMGFDYLTQMRANSPTGGALGNVSDTENKLTQATSEALDQGVSPAVLKERLAKVLELRKRLLAERHEDYERTVEALTTRRTNTSNTKESSASLARPSGASTSQGSPDVAAQTAADAVRDLEGNVISPATQQPKQVGGFKIIEVK